MVPLRGRAQCVTLRYCTLLLGPAVWSSALWERTHISPLNATFFLDAVRASYNNVQILNKELQALSIAERLRFRMYDHACSLTAIYVWFILVDYILMDPAERERLLIGSTPRPFPLRVIRAPVPWHSSYKEAKSWNESNLFIVNPLMHTLHQLWLSE